MPHKATMVGAAELLFNRYTLAILELLYLVGVAHSQSPPPPTDHPAAHIPTYSHPARPELDGAFPDGWNPPGIADWPSSFKRRVAECAADRISSGKAANESPQAILSICANDREVLRLWNKDMGR